MKRTTRLVLAIVTLFSLTFAATLATTSTAQAQTAADRQKAGGHFARGKNLFSEGDYSGALVEFERAYRLAPNWRVLFNIGQVKYQLQDYPGAKDALERYLREGGAEIDKERREQVRSDIQELNARVAYVTISVNEAGARITIDDREVGVSPIAQKVPVSAGRRKITATSDGAQPAVQFVDVAGGDSVAVQLNLQRATVPTPTPFPTPDPDTPEPETNIPWAAWGVTAGLAAGTLIFGLLSLDAASTLEDTKGKETTKDELDGDRGRLLGFSVATDVLLGATVILAGVSVYLTVTGGDGEDDASAVELRVFPGGLGLQGAF